jgi:hypothetical protein
MNNEQYRQCTSLFFESQSVDASEVELETKSVLVGPQMILAQGPRKIRWGDRSVEALIIGTAIEVDSSRVELATGDSSRGSAAWLTVGAGDGTMWFGAPGSALSGALGTCVDPKATLETGTGACTSIMT